MESEGAVATTYVIGAGASRHAKYPLASDMGPGVIDFMLGMQHPYPPLQARWLIDTFGQQPNIEEVITELGLRIEAARNAGTGADPSPLSPGNVRGWVAHSLREWFRQIHTGTAAAYAEFADKVTKPGDVVITFNYDDSLERELRRARKWDAVSGYGFPFGGSSRPSDVLVLKLHGSMNWLWPVFSSAGRPLIHTADLEHLGYDDSSDFAGYLFQNGGSVPTLILPDREKMFFYKTSFGIEGREFWDYLWSQATEAVRRSDRLVLCGYSLLPVDQRACALLLNEPKKEAQITVVSGERSGRIAADLGTAGFKNVDVFDDGFFEDWVHQKAELGVAHSN
jgi:hypothetical protein